MAVLQHGHLLETVVVVLDLEVTFSFCAPVFAMSIMNLILYVMMEDPSTILPYYGLTAYKYSLELI
jgi:hypothetical protein